MKILGIINRKLGFNGDINVGSIVFYTDSYNVFYTDIYKKKCFMSASYLPIDCTIINEINDLRKSTNIASESYLSEQQTYKRTNSTKQFKWASSQEESDSNSETNHFVNYIVQPDPNYVLQTDFLCKIDQGIVKRYSPEHFEEGEIQYLYNSTYKYALIAAPNIKQLPVLIQNHNTRATLGYISNSIRKLSYSTYINSKGATVNCLKIYFAYSSIITNQDIGLTLKSFKYPQTPIN